MYTAVQPVAQLDILWGGGEFDFEGLEEGYRGEGLAPLAKFLKNKLLFLEFEVKKTAFFNRWRVGSVLNNIPNSYNNNGLFLCLKKNTFLYSFKMNDMSKLIKHVREAPKFFFILLVSFHVLLSVC